MTTTEADYRAFAERQGREATRVTAKDAALEKVLEDLLLGLNDHESSELAAREAQSVIANCAKAASEATQPSKCPSNPVNEAANRALENYKFPETTVAQHYFAPLSDCDLAKQLNSLVGTSSRFKPLMPYHFIREQYCAICMVMNERGLQPPRFRPHRALPHLLQKATSDETLMMRDRQVIDMHWLHCGGKRDTLSDKTFADLFVDDELDFDLAAYLAEKSWKVEVKTSKVLNLIGHEELQMAYLRTKAIADAWRNAENTMKNTVDRRLREQLVSTPSLKPHIEDFKQLWLADKIVGEMGLAAIAQMHGWLSGKSPLATTTLSEKLRRMRRRTAAKVGKP